MPRPYPVVVVGVSWVPAMKRAPATSCRYGAGMLRLLSCSLMTLSLVACQSVTSPEAYDRSCTADADCTLMPFGDQCDDCAEAFDAVNINDVDAILDDAAAAGQGCPFWSQLDAKTCALAPPSTSPVCVDNRCQPSDNSEPCAPAGRGLCQGVN